MRKLTFLYVIFSTIIFPAYSIAAEGFPGRSSEKYRDVPYIEISDLYKKINEVVVVDTRSKFEFDTLKIKQSINIPIALKSFDSDVKVLREKTNKPIVFYCNGHTCMKSYKAAKRAMDLGIKNVFAYDAGIFDWAKSYPEKAELLGNSPVAQKDILTLKQYKSRLLNPDEFSARATDDPSKVIILDIRDEMQRLGVGFFPMQERWVSLNKIDKIYQYIKKAKEKKKVLFIYDEVGKQVRWLQYALEKAGLKDYYFMEKGATGYYKMISNFNGGKS